MSSEDPESFTPYEGAPGFYWFTRDNTQKSIPACSPFPITTTENGAAASTPRSPFYFQALAPGYPPEVLRVDANLGETFEWTPTYPIGTRVTFNMFDSQGRSGGVATGFSIVADSETCTPVSRSAAPLSLECDPPELACDKINVNITGGKAPYTLTVVDISGSKALNVSNAPAFFELKNLIESGNDFSVFAIDASGQPSVLSDYMTSRLNQTGCIQPTQHKSKEVSNDAWKIVVGVLVPVFVLLGVFLAFAIKKWRRNVKGANNNPSENPIAPFSGPAAASNFETTIGPAMGYGRYPAPVHSSPLMAPANPSQTGAGIPFIPMSPDRNSSWNTSSPASTLPLYHNPQQSPPISEVGGPVPYHLTPHSENNTVYSGPAWAQGQRTSYFDEYGLPTTAGAHTSMPYPGEATSNTKNTT